MKKRYSGSRRTVPNFSCTLPTWRASAKASTRWDRFWLLSCYISRLNAFPFCSLLRPSALVSPSRVSYLGRCFSLRRCIYFFSWALPFDGRVCVPFVCVACVCLSLSLQRYWRDLNRLVCIFFLCEVLFLSRLEFCSNWGLFPSRTLCISQCVYM